MSYFGQQYPLYVPPSISGTERVRITTMKQTSMMEMAQHTSKGMVIFGATGDLCKRKLIPALFKLWQKTLLPPDFVITGASRRDPGRDHWIKSLGMYPDEFTNLLDFVSCDLNDPESLYHLPTLDDTTYFLSVPPERYENAITSLKSTGRLDDPETSRVVIEKPFGHDYKSADHLSGVIARHLREKQVFRIDHYLGKDTVNNILATRFSNILLEPLWNRQYVDEIQIFATETIGCEGRSQYYETAGQVRDMLQNHVLQVMALIAMEPPCRMSDVEIRREKVKVLAATRLSENIILDNMKAIVLKRGLILSVVLLPILVVLYMSITGDGLEYLLMS